MPSCSQCTANAVSSAATSPVGWPCVSADWNWARAARSASSTVDNRPTGATRMFAPHPLDAALVACRQGNPSASCQQASRHVRPGARLLSGLFSQATNSARSSGSTVATVNSPAASRSARATARVIWVSSVISAGSPERSRGPPGP
jgi:hypothetical protein